MNNKKRTTLSLLQENVYVYQNVSIEQKKTAEQTGILHWLNLMLGSLVCKVKKDMFLQNKAK